MVPTLLARIEDMLEAIAEITRATAGKSFEAFQRNWVLRKAAERGIEIIAEASRHLPDDLKSRHPYGRWRDVAGIGNVLRHEYHRVEDRIIWTVIREELPRLRVHLEAMRSEIVGDLRE
jgi:uncharacterized protein with HEPN domain